MLIVSTDFFNINHSRLPLVQESITSNKVIPIYICKFLLVDFEVTLYNSVESPKIRKIFLYSYLVLVSSRSVKTREFSFAQFV
jgi:hypothetical protein